LRERLKVSVAVLAFGRLKFIRRFLSRGAAGLMDYRSPIPYQQLAEHAAKL